MHLGRLPAQAQMAQADKFDLCLTLQLVILSTVAHLVQGFTDRSCLAETAPHQAHKLMQQSDPSASC